MRHPAIGMQAMKERQERGGERRAHGPMMAVFAVLVALVVHAGAGAAVAEVRFSTRISTYAVTGADPVAVLNSMRRNGPVVEGRRAFASTHTRARWMARFRQVGRRCRVERLVVHARFDIRLPRAVEYARFPPVVQREWRQFVHILARHERTHVRIYRHCIARAARRQRGMTAPTCRQLKDRLRRSFRRTLAACNKAHDRLDHRDVSRTPRIPFVRRAIRMQRARGQRRLIGG